jgi:hypothetical protein
MADVTLTITLADIEASACDADREPRLGAVRARLSTLAQPLESPWETGLWPRLRRQMPLP